MCQSSSTMSCKKQKRILPEADSDPHHTSKMDLPAKQFNGIKLLDVFTKYPILFV